MINELYSNAVALLQQLIAIPSFSKEEDKTADTIEKFLQSKNVSTHRYLNNVWAVNTYFDAAKPSILLNSHHDTVKPNAKYTKDPFTASVIDGKLFGLGSNDAGGCLVSLIAVFLYFFDKENMPYNFILAATAEEEITGKNGIEALLKEADFLQKTQIFQHQNSCAIVGEPTLMNLAIAEKGLMVLDCSSEGIAGHAARNEGDNAIYKALKDIQWFQEFEYPKKSEWLGPVKQTVTVIETENKAHNVVPPICNFVVDIRIPDVYTHEDILEIIGNHISCNFKERSVRLRSSRIELEHPLVQSGLALGKEPYGSPTCSDKALIPLPTLKMGPGDSARSHTADEFIYLDEIRNGIKDYISLLEKLIKNH